MSTQRRGRFYLWLMQYLKVDDRIGDLARDAADDFSGNSCWPDRGHWNGSPSDLKSILAEWGDANARDTMELAEKRYAKYRAGK